MTELIRWDFRGLQAEGGVKDRVLPGSMGRGDKGYPYYEVAISHDLGGVSEILGDYARATVTPDYGHTSGAEFRHKIGNKALEIGFYFTGTNTPGPNIDTYSFYFVLEHLSGYPLGQQVDFFEIRDSAGALKWGLGYKPSGGGNWDQNFNIGVINQGRTPFAWHLYSQVQNVRYKYEIQVKPTAPKVTVRMYSESEYGKEDWTLWTYEVTANPDSVSGNSFRIGLPQDYYNIIIAPDKRLYGIRCWDTSNGDGTFPNTTIPKVVRRPTAKLKTESGYVDVDIEAHWDGEDYGNLDLVLNRVRTNSFRGRRERSPVPYDSFMSNYNPGGHSNQIYTVYTPKGTPPPGGWPTIYWVVCDYFVTGYAAQFSTLNYRWILYDWLSRGYAVVSVGVRNASQANSVTTPSRPSDGVWPDQVMDVKNAVKHAMANYPQLHPTKRIMGGYSGGGFVAGAAALTRDLTDPVNGINYKVISGSDPEFSGLYLINAPIDLDPLRTFDLSHPWYNIWALPFTTPKTGTLHAVISSLMGYTNAANPDVSRLSLSLWASMNPSARLPIFSATSGCDMLIPSHLEDALYSVYNFAEESDKYTRYYSPGATHISAALDMPLEMLSRWFNETMDI